MNGELPPDPITALAEAAGGLHVMFESLVEAGFTELQACRIIGVMLGESSRPS